MFQIEVFESLEVIFFVRGDKFQDNFVLPFIDIKCSHYHFVEDILFSTVYVSESLSDIILM